MKRFIVTAMLSIFLVAHPTCFASGQIKVQVASEGYRASSIESYVSRELRRLGDVEVVSNLGEYVFGTTSLEITGQGVAISFTYLKIGSQIDLTEAVRPEYMPLYKSFFENIVLFQGSNIAVTGFSDLEDTCKQAVAEFDTIILKRAREAKRAPGRINN